MQNLLKDPYNYASALSTPNLVILLQDLSDKYYNTDQPLVSDNVYDSLIEVLKTKDPKNKFLKTTGAPVSKNMVHLPYPMPSLDKLKEEKAISKWKEKYEGPYVISEKIDGVAALIYKDENGKLTMYSRGECDKGQDISHLLKYVLDGSVKTEKMEKKTAIRGELVISKEDFGKLQGYKNARNAVAGLVNCKTVEKRLPLAKSTKFLAHALIYPEMDAMDQFETMKKLGFQVVYNKASHDITMEELSELLLERREGSDYKTDGLVVVDSQKFYEVTMDYPEHAFAFKKVSSDQIGESTVVDILWKTSKHGLIKPRIKIEPITLVDVEITFMTGYNAKYIFDNKLGPGAVIEIIRSGDVIPKVQKIVESADEPKMPDIEYTWNETGVDILVVKKDESQVIEQITHFFKTLDIKGVAQGTIKKFYEAGYKSLFEIIENKDNLCKIKGIGKKVVDKIFEGLVLKLKGVELNTLMAASTIFGTGLGKRIAKVIVDNIPDILTLNISNEKLVEKLVDLNGIGPITAKHFVERLPEFVEFYKKLEGLFILTKPKPIKMDTDDHDSSESEGDGCAGKTYDFSGHTIVFSGFRNSDWQALIMQHGGKVTTSVSKKTTLVVYAKTDTDKYKKAVEYGVETISMSKFKEKYF